MIPVLVAAPQEYMNSEVAALGVITIFRGCFERCCSNKKTPLYHSNLSFPIQHVGSPPARAARGRGSTRQNT